MAQLQRGEPQPNPEKPGKVLEEMADWSEDEGPDEVGFEESKSAALRSAEEELRASRREKELLKEKRRKRQQFFQEQKKKRLLSDTLLEQLDTVPQKQKKPSEDKDEKAEEPEKELKLSKTKKASRRLQGNSSVMRVKDGSDNALMQQTAMNFIHTRLYGSGTQRTTNAELLSLERKVGAQQGAAVQFVNKTWGTEKKAKAEKSNKRFIHRRKLVSS